MSINHNYDEQKKLLIKEIERLDAIILNLIQHKDLELLNAQNSTKLKEYYENNKILKHKLESNEFEIAIVGLEKAGKSTFANALIDNYVLPSAPERCTFTATKLISGVDEAIVEFYTEHEFDEIFQEMLQELQYPNAEEVSYKTLTLTDFKNFFNTLEETNNALYKSHVGKTDQEIIDILKTTSNLRLDGSKIIFSGDELSKDDFQSYIKGEINDTSKPRSVKSIEIKSSKLDSMENAILYDVPGFDSPTKLHLRQTEDRLKKADAIILVTNVGTNPSIQGTSLSIITKNTDGDGIPLKDKLFVFGNQIDRVNKFDDIDRNFQTLKGDVLKYQIGTEERTFAGSALKYLVLEKSIVKDEGYDCRYSDLNSGIEDIRKKLEEYYQTDRFKILKQKIEKNNQLIQDIFDDIKKNNISDKYNMSEDGQKGQIIAVENQQMKQRISTDLKYFVDKIKKQIYDEQWLSHRIEEEIQKNDYFSDISEGLFEHTRVMTNDSARTNTEFEKINQEMRKKLHLKYLENYVFLIRNITDEKCKEVEISLIQTFISAVTGTNLSTDVIKKECESIIYKITAEVAHDPSRFMYLIERFSRDIFDILLSSPVASDDRSKRFIHANNDMRHLDHYYSKGKGDLITLLLTQQEVSLIDQIPKIANEIGKLVNSTWNINANAALSNVNNIMAFLKNLPLEATLGTISDVNELLVKYKVASSTTKEAVVDEINKDINNLKKVLIKAVIPAANLEFSYVNSVDKQIKLLLSAMLEQDNRYSAAFNEFLSKIIPIVKHDELQNVSNTIEKIKLKNAIIESL
ncbi:hypothetical protein B9T21_06915 [Wohlfahrtiimonas chitiniclastica]|uniref:dynamin family protein n=1 Tax=Wohlfahrtiimonas chitiniclastica TaxID=400946 RepID=UPI000B98700B|nr:dynamin family protein [Wohlfahrtiimonas chitiniclastica]OYQ87262.1 hypothetical protein B9T21_06915 [Wohlfahrtiimonas chitiniclastica]